MMDRLAEDLAAVDSMKAIPTMLDVVCRATGIGSFPFIKRNNFRLAELNIFDGIG